MAKHYRKSRGRKSHKRHSRRRHTRRQQGGAGTGCAIFPANTNTSFAQRGGMAPYEVGGTDYLIDAPTRVQAEVGSLDQAFAELPGVLKAAGVVPNQLGGARRRKYRKSHRKRSGRSRKGSRRQRQRKQSGGMAPFNAPYEMYPGGVPVIPPPQRGGAAQSAVMAPFSAVSEPSLLPVGSLYGQNPQFVTEAGVNSLYRYEGGAQVA